MKEKFNPYYSPEKLDLELISVDQPNLSYEYNTLCFWATKDGKVYSASDSGCSCPTPFEQYQGEDQSQVLKLLNRISNMNQAAYIFNSWNEDFSGRPYIKKENEISNLFKWIEERLKL